MKKTNFKVHFLLILSILIGSCEKNDDILDPAENKILEFSSKANIVDQFNDTGEELSNTNTQNSLFRIIGYEGPVQFDFINGKVIPFVDTIIILETSQSQFAWLATGSLEIIGDPTGNRIRCQRTSLEPGGITLVTSQYLSSIQFDQAPPYARCPDDTDTLMIAGTNRVINIRNYTEGFTYEWAVTNGNNTFNSAGRSVTLPTGSSTVTLTALNTINGTSPVSVCPKPTRTQNFTFVDSPLCPLERHTLMRIDINRRTAYAQNYDSSFTYKWTVVKNNNTYHGTGRNIYLGVGSVKVTLTVSKTGCTTKTRTQTDYIDACPTC